MFNMFHIVPLMDMCCSSGFSACLTLVVATTLVTIPMVKKMSKMFQGEVLIALYGLLGTSTINGGIMIVIM